MEHIAYDTVEICYPSQRVDEWMPYCKNENYHIGMVYGYVPLDVVESAIAMHGGIIGSNNEGEKFSIEQLGDEGVE